MSRSSSSATVGWSTCSNCRQFHSVTPPSTVTARVSRSRSPISRASSMAWPRLAEAGRGADDVSGQPPFGGQPKEDGEALATVGGPRLQGGQGPGAVQRRLVVRESQRRPVRRGRAGGVRRGGWRPGHRPEPMVSDLVDVVIEAVGVNVLDGLGEPAVESCPSLRCE